MDLETQILRNQDVARLFRVQPELLERNRNVKMINPELCRVTNVKKPGTWKWRWRDFSTTVVNTTTRDTRSLVITDNCDRTNPLLLHKDYHQSVFPTSNMDYDSLYEDNASDDDQEQQNDHQDQAAAPAPVEAKPQQENTTKQSDLSAEEPNPAPVPAPVPAPAPAPAPVPKQAPKRSAPQNDLELANDEIANLLLTNRITVYESSKFQAILRENATLKEKVNKLKTLLVRSAKASKETKQDLEQHKHLLDVAQKEVERLNDRVEALASRPTHMDLLADFETNFDKAMMNLNTDGMADGNQVARQSVGQPTEQKNDEENLTNMLMAELNQTKTRVENLESVNTALKKRSMQFEKQNDYFIQERESGESLIRCDRQPA
jgi:hypothetical protein